MPDEKPLRAAMPPGREETREQQVKRLREELERKPKARELRALLATPAAVHIRKWLLDDFLLSSPRGSDSAAGPAPFWLGYWQGQKEIAQLLLGYSGGLKEALTSEGTGSEDA